MPAEKTNSERQPYRARLPGFVSDKDIGLGDVIKRVTYAFEYDPAVAANTGLPRSTAGSFSPGEPSNTVRQFKGGMRWNKK
jgi:hypothetical protein